MISAFDADGDGTISLLEFVAGVKRFNVRYPWIPLVAEYVYAGGTGACLGVCALLCAVQ